MSQEGRRRAARNQRRLQRAGKAMVWAMAALTVLLAFQL
jgi:hypothetical protein